MVQVLHRMRWAQHEVLHDTLMQVEEEQTGEQQRRGAAQLTLAQAGGRLKALKALLKAAEEAVKAAATRLQVGLL